MTQTRSADGVGAGGVSSESERWTSAEEEAIELEARAEEARDAATRARARARAAAPGGVPGHPGAIPPRTTFDPPATRVGLVVRRRALADFVSRTGVRGAFRRDAPRGRSKRAWRRFETGIGARCFARGPSRGGTRPRRRRSERRNSASREQLATIAARLAAAAGAPSHPGSGTGPSRRWRRRRRRRRRAPPSDPVPPSRKPPTPREASRRDDAVDRTIPRPRRRNDTAFAEEGPGAGRSTDANAEGADVGVSRVKPPRAPPRSNASEAFADAASDAAEAFSRARRARERWNPCCARDGRVGGGGSRERGGTRRCTRSAPRRRARADGEEDGEGVGEATRDRNSRGGVASRGPRESRRRDAAAAAAAVRKSRQETKSSEVVFGGNGGGGRPETARVPRVPPGRYARAAAAGYCAENERAGGGGGADAVRDESARAEPRPRRASRAPRPSMISGSASVDGSDGGV